MAIGTPVNIGNNGATTDPLAITTTSTVNVGSTIFLALSQQVANSITSVIDSAGNTYVQDVTIGTNHKAYIYRANVSIQLPSGGTITVAKTAATGLGMAAISVTGLDTSPLDASGTGSNASSTNISATVVATASNMLILGIAGYEVFNLTQPGGAWTNLTGNTASSNSKIDWAYQVNVGPASYTYNPTLNIAEHWGAIAVSYKATASGGTPQLMLLGVGI